MILQTYRQYSKHVIQVLNEPPKKKLMGRNLVFFKLLLPPLQTETFLVVCRQHLFCGFLCCSLSQNGFFTDKGEHCAVKKLLRHNWVRLRRAAFFFFFNPRVISTGSNHTKRHWGVIYFFIYLIQNGGCFYTNIKREEKTTAACEEGNFHKTGVVRRSVARLTRAESSSAFVGTPSPSYTPLPYKVTKNPLQRQLCCLVSRRK